MDFTKKKIEIDYINYVSLIDIKHPDHDTMLTKLHQAMTETGFFILKNSPISRTEIDVIFDQYKLFFKRPVNEKNSVNMAFTNSNRGWGASKSEQVNKNYNPDFKEIYDCGPEIDFDHEFKTLPYYAKNIWPNDMPELKKIAINFYNKCNKIGIKILEKIAKNLDLPEYYFSDKFDLPMGLLRCNFYPEKPKNTKINDFGIAPHSDYGCLTLLFTEGDPGLEIKTLNKNWTQIQAKKDEIIINFGDMLQLWSDHKVKATLHKVKGTKKERFSIPFFFNPRHDTIISNKNNKKVIAGEYLSFKYNTTYKHQKKSHKN